MSRVGPSAQGLVDPISKRLTRETDIWLVCFAAFLFLKLKEEPVLGPVPVVLART
jgi:hypothetical protein